MDNKDALVIFDSLSQETRLRAFRLLVQAGPAGLAAGAISTALDIPHNSLSFHLNHLSGAGIITAQRQGRSILYRANFARIQHLIRFIVKDCCDSRVARMQDDDPEACMIVDLIPCCEPPQ